MGGIAMILYLISFVLRPSFQDEQNWVKWIISRLSVVHPHIWTSSRFFGGFATLLLEESVILSFFIFTFFALTDWVDGKVARYRNEQGSLGAKLDGAADKIFVLPIIWWWGTQYIYWPFVLLLGIIEASGYILIPAALRWNKIKKENIFEHIMAGKYKFFCQVLLVFVLWAANNFGDGGEFWIGGIWILLAGSIVLAIMSIAGKINPRWAI